MHVIIEEKRQIAWHDGSTSRHIVSKTVHSASLKQCLKFNALTDIYWIVQIGTNQWCLESGSKQIRAFRNIRRSIRLNFGAAAASSLTTPIPPPLTQTVRQGSLRTILDLLETLKFWHISARHRLYQSLNKWYLWTRQKVTTR